MPYIKQYDFLRIILKIFLDKTTTHYFGLTVPPKMITLTILNLHYLNLLSHRLKLHNLDFCLYRIYMYFTTLSRFFVLWLHLADFTMPHVAHVCNEAQGHLVSPCNFASATCRTLS